jgi:alpha-tubulin suppressor-like RCC1 family protein
MSKRVLCAFVVLAVVYSIVFADIREDSKGLKISGGENHTLVLTKDNKLWGCGDNEYYQLGIGDTKASQNLLVQVSGPNDVGHLTDIKDLDAGFMHSIALDNDGFAWTINLNLPCFTKKNIINQIRA